MKLIVRTPYWGSHVEGRMTQLGVAPFEPCRMIRAQIEFQPKPCRDKLKWGCCKYLGESRVLELTESHFLDTHDGKWNLFRMRYFDAGQGVHIHEFALLPDNQTSIKTKSAVSKAGWQFWGKLHACILRMDLEPLFKPIIEELKEPGSKKTHVHMFILMDVAEDKDPPLQSTVAKARYTEAKEMRKLYFHREQSRSRFYTTCHINTTIDQMKHESRPIMARGGPIMPQAVPQRFYCRPMPYYGPIPVLAPTARNASFCDEKEMTRAYPDVLVPEDIYPRPSQSPHPITDDEASSTHSGDTCQDQHSRQLQTDQPISYRPGVATIGCYFAELSL